jgi:(2Fe-2S) ferredoxin
MAFERHVFVCVNNRPPFAKPSCAPRGAASLLQALAGAIEERGLSRSVGLTATLCLGPCEQGPTMVVYPDGVWYRGVQEADIGDIVSQHLIAGQPVERLRHRPAEG